MTHDPMHDTATDEIVVELEKAGLVETFTNAEGKVAYSLTPRGAQLGRSMALAGDEDAAKVLDALLDEGGSSMSTLARGQSRRRVVRPLTRGPGRGGWGHRLGEGADEADSGSAPGRRDGVRDRLAGADPIRT